MINFLIFSYNKRSFFNKNQKRIIINDFNEQRLGVADAIRTRPKGSTGPCANHYTTATIKIKFESAIPNQYLHIIFYPLLALQQKTKMF